MSDLIVVYRGLVNVSLGVMSRDCISIVTPLLNNLEVTEGLVMRPPASLEMKYEWYDGLTKRSSVGTDNMFSIRCTTTTPIPNMSATRDCIALSDPTVVLAPA